jgi:hypothetical protein
LQKVKANNARFESIGDVALVPRSDLLAIVGGRSRKITLFISSIGVISNAQNEVHNEESEEGRVSSEEWREAKKNMKRKVIVPALCALLFALCLPAAAQQQAKVPRIGYLSLAAKASPRDEAFVKQLRDLGWVDGQNIAIEYR